MLRKYLNKSLRCTQNLCWYGTSSDAVFTAETLLATTNRQRCIDCMKKSPPLGLKLQKSETEKNFAAVLIAVCTNEKGEPSVLFTKRSGTLSRHVRQISFPGGIKDSTDVDYIDCALRETEEEIGLPRERVQIWGTGNFITPPHTAAITPVVGSIENFSLDELKLNRHEVDEAFILPISHLVSPTAMRHTQFKAGYSAPVFVVDNYRIWGVTGFLTNIFLSCLVPHELHNLKRNRVRFIKPFRSTKS